MFRMWLGLGEHLGFKKSDRPIFMVVPMDGNREMHLSSSKFIDADSLEAARQAVHAEVDRWFGQIKRVDGLSAVSEARNVEAAKSSDSIQISEGGVRPKSGDLFDLLG